MESAKSSAIPRRGGPILLGMLAFGALIAAVWFAADLVGIQGRLRTAATWLEEADDWQTTLFATARAAESGEIVRRPEGGFEIPWDPDAEAFPISVPFAESRMLALLGLFPLDLAEHSEVRMAFRGSNALLVVELARAQLETGYDIRATARAIDRHSAAVGRLAAPVGSAVAADADALTARAFWLAASVILLAVLLVAMARLKHPGRPAWKSPS